MIWWSGDFSKEVRFGDCDFSKGELMKTLTMEEKYSKGIKIGTLFWLGQVVTGWAAVKHKQGIGEKSGEQKLHEGTRRLCMSTRKIQRGTVMRQQVQGEEEFPVEAQSRDY